METRTDGAAWPPPTPGTAAAPMPGAMPVPVPVSAPMPTPARSRPAGVPALQNEIARWSRICAIISVFVNPLLLVSIVAIVLGIVGLERSKKPPFAGRWDSGRRQALTGIGIGVLGMALGVLTLAVLVSTAVSNMV